MLKKLPFFLPLAGCRGQCVYCDQRAITGVRAVPSPADVREALRGLAGPREICYFGGSFCRFAPQLIKEYLDCVTEHAPAGSTVRFSTYPRATCATTRCAASSKNILFQESSSASRRSTPPSSPHAVARPTPKKYSKI